MGHDPPGAGEQGPGGNGVGPVASLDGEDIGLPGGVLAAVVAPASRGDGEVVGLIPFQGDTAGDITRVDDDVLPGGGSREEGGPCKGQREEGDGTRPPFSREAPFRSSFRAKRR